jgi:Tfp pilus assembly protein PilF
VLLAALVVIPAMFLSPQFYDYYSYFPHVFLSLLLAVCVGQFTTILRRFVQRDGQHRWRDLLLRAAPAAIVVALAIAVIPSDVTYADGYLAGSIDPGPVASAVIPQGSCVTFDQPGLAINANRFVPSASGCPAIVDPFGMWLTRNDGDQPGSSQPLVPAFVADWRTWLSQSQYVLLTVQLSDFIPWTPALITWFNSHFTLVTSAPHTFVYKNNAFSPSTASGNAPPEDAAQLVAAGLKAEQEGRTNLAYSDYRKAFTKDHSNAVALYDLGHIDQERGQIAQAADEYQAALKADPTFTDALYNMGVLDASRNPTAAVLYYTRTVQLEPNNAAANFNLGVLLIKLGHNVQGDVYLKTALRLDPSLANDLPPGITVPSSGPS